MKIKKLTKVTIIIVFNLIVLSTIAFFLREFISNYYVKLNLDNIKIPNSGSRVLVFSPHNDDEVLSSANLIRSTIANHGQVKVVFMTNGDGFKNAIQFDYLNLYPKAHDYINFGYTRQKESLNALKCLGVNKDNVIFLGYPDGGISYLWNVYWNADKPYISNFTQVSKSPYSNSYTKNAPYAGESIVSDITKIIKDFRPTEIVFPHPNDRHPDHWATNCFVNYSLAAMNYQPDTKLLYLVHRGDWPTPMKKETQMYLVPPAKLINKGTVWQALDMNNEELMTKINAINQYKSQKWTLGILLDSFERKNELFGEYQDVHIASNLNYDNNISANSNNNVIIDPLQDALHLTINRSADIANVYGEVSKNNNLHIFIETDQKLENGINYQINLIFFGDRISRMNLEIKNKKIIEKQVSKQSLSNIKGIRFSVQGKFLHVIIPENISGNYNHIFINAITSSEGLVMDKTAWRMLDK